MSQTVSPNWERGDVQGPSISTPDHVSAAIINMCVIVVAKYAQEQEGYMSLHPHDWRGADNGSGLLVAVGTEGV